MWRLASPKARLTLRELENLHALEGCGVGVKEPRTQEDVPVFRALAPMGLRAYAGFSGLTWANGLPAESRVCVPWLVPENETCDMWSRPDGMHSLETHMAGAT